MVLKRRPIFAIGSNYNFPIQLLNIDVGLWRSFVVFVVFNYFAGSNGLCGQSAGNTSDSATASTQSHAICAGETVQSLSDCAGAAQEGRGSEEN